MSTRDPLTVIARRYLARLGRVLYDSETQQFLGRTWRAWARVGAFFSVFYSILAVIFAIHLAIFLAITPGPSEGRTPWNFGRYAYSNYPNRKIDLIITPKSFSVSVNNTGFGSAVMSDSDLNYLTRLQASAEASGVDAICLDRGTRFGFSIGLPCVYLHIAKVFEWTPELINSTLRDKTLLTINCTLGTANPNLQFPIDSQPRGLPLNISNNAGSRSYPFKNQPNFRTPVMSLMLDLTGLQRDNLPSSFEVRIACQIDFDAMDVANPSDRSYETPTTATTAISFRS